MRAAVYHFQHPVKMENGTRLGPYEVVAPIGAGGMGEVYRARDTRLGRTVAIKILPAQFAHDARLKLRLEREARTISQLNHPNICTLYDVGDSYLVMEYCEGRTLASRLRDGPMPLDELLRCGIDIADALDRAHRQGVVHRDLKPANVMLTDSGAKLLDFGLARRETAPTDDSATAEIVTEEGTIVGTMQYMAPEVLRGKAADARSDLFALGLILYEMASGKRAFDGSSKPEVIAAILEREPVPVADLAPQTPPALDLLVRACLVKDPEERIQTANDVRRQLRSIADGRRDTTSPPALPYASAGASRSRLRMWRMGAAVLLLLIAAAAGVWMWRQRAAAISRVSSIAVLPFENLSTPADEYLVDGLQDGVIGELSRVGGLRMISRTSAGHYRRTGKTIPEIARELGVDGVVEGSVSRSGQDLRVQVRLVRARPEERQIWANEYERAIAGASSLPTDIARAVAFATNVALTPDEKASLSRASRTRAENYERYLKGMFYVRQETGEAAQQAIASFQEIVARDPADPAAHAGLALAYAILTHGPSASGDVYAQAKAEAMRAIELDDTVAEAHAALGAIAMYHDWDWTTAGRELRRALQLNPSLAQAHRDYAWFLELPKLDPRAVEEMKRAKELDPLTRLYTSDLAYLYYRRGQIQDALREAREAAQLGQDWQGTFILVIASSESGLHDEAIDIAKRATLARGTKYMLAYAYAKAGRRAEAEKVAQEVASSTAPSRTWGLALTYAALGNKEETLRWLEKGVDLRFGFLLWIKDNPAYKSLRGDPRFEALVRRFNLPKG